MRVSDAFTQRTFLRDLGRVKQQMNSAMARVSSGYRVRYASDDSQAAGELLRIADESRKLATRREVLSQARPWLQLSEQAVTELSKILRTAQDLGIQGASETLQQENRNAIAAQVAGLREQLDGLTNLRISGRYIFSGSLTTTPPFDSTGAYQGNSDGIEMLLDEQSQTINLPGDEVFGEEGVGGPRELLKRLEESLRAGDTSAIQNVLQPIRDAIAQNTALIARVGNRSKALEDADARLQDRQLAVAQRASDLGSADMAEALSDVQRFQTGYQATLAAGSRLFGPNFFDYLG